MNASSLFLAVALGAVVATAPGNGRAEPLADNERIEVIPTRPGVTVPVLLVMPKGAPLGSVLLFAGGNGRLELSSKGIGAGSSNFVVRTRKLFADAGFVAAVIDAPSDRPKGLSEFRTTEAHAQDVITVINWLGKKWDVPISLVGTSRGTISAANVMARRPYARRRALILSSSVTTGKKESLKDVHLEDIASPILFVHNKDDACKTSPPEGPRELMKRLKSARSKRIEIFEGGTKTDSKPCGPLSYHGFLGLDDKVVKLMVDWLKANAH